MSQYAILVRRAVRPRPPVSSRGEAREINDFEVFTFSVYNALGVGHENAQTRRELCRTLRCGDRSLRKAIEILRQDYPIITQDDGRGYYIPLSTPEGRQEAARWAAKQDKRIKSIRASQRGARRFAGGMRSKGIPGQLNMFGGMGGG